jgi:drug/metabolite transporter (DMT)-like permease
MRVFVAILLGGLTSTLYALATSLQALEARRTSADSALRASLIETLVRRKLWLLGTACGLIAWPIQAIALSLASVAIVQPALGLGLIVLLFLGVRLLHERVGPREIVGAVSITAAIAALGWAAPPETGAFTRGGQVVVVGLIVVAAAGPYLLRALHRADGLPTSIAAGLGWAAVGLSTVLIDESIAQRHALGLVLWGAATAAVGWSGLLSEMTALQTWPATRAIPVVFGLEMALPAALAPFLTKTSPNHVGVFVVALAVALGGAVLLGSSRAVARAAHPDEPLTET